MSVRVERVSVDGFTGFRLRNDLVSATVIPDLGGRVWELTDLVRDRQWVWHREGVPLVRAEPGAAYDDVWAGGWEQLFPNDAPGSFEGRTLPDHGEWWAAQWRVVDVEEGGRGRIRLQTDLDVVGAACTKELLLRSGENRLEVVYRIEGRERVPAHFLFKEHLPVAVTPGCELFTTGGVVEVVEPGFGTLVRTDRPVAWTAAVGGDGGLGVVPPPEQKEREFVYVSGLPEGACGVGDPEAGARLRMEFDRTQLPYLWLFLTYGGWRGCYTAVLEPCTNKPKDLAQAAELGQSAKLEPGCTFETRVAVVLSGYEGE